MEKQIELVKVYISKLNYKMSTDDKGKDAFMLKHRKGRGRVTFSIVYPDKSKKKKLLKLEREYIVRSNNFIIFAVVNAVVKTKKEDVEILLKDKKTDADKKKLLRIAEYVFRAMSDKVSLYTGLLSAETGYPSFYIPTFGKKIDKWSF